MAAKRLVGGVVVLWATATVIFVLQALTETNRAKPVIQQLSGSSQNPTKADLSAFNHRFGLNQSVLHQYWDWLAGIADGDFGISYFQHAPATTIISRELGPTMVLTFVSLALGWLLAVGVTVVAAGRNNFFSRLATGFQLLTASFQPTGWARSSWSCSRSNWGWFPVEGATGVTSGRCSRR